MKKLVVNMRDRPLDFYLGGGCELELLDFWGCVMDLRGRPLEFCGGRWMVAVILHQNSTKPQI